jgi:ABC-type transport system substrate-binding protein/DNA-binding FadR family transcriptional regulator
MARLHRELMRLLVADVVAGRLPAGGRLPGEVELARRFGVSRCVMRETLRALEERGLVSVRHGSGTTVNRPERWDLFDPDVLATILAGAHSRELLGQCLECRRVLEVEAAGLAAERACERRLDAAADALEAMERALARAPSEAAERRFREGEAAFQRTLAAASGNLALSGLLGPIRVALLLAGEPRMRPRQRLEQALAEHRRIFDAVLARDPAGARAGMEEHLGTAARALAERAGSGGSEPGAGDGLGAAEGLHPVDNISYNIMTECLGEDTEVERMSRTEEPEARAARADGLTRQAFLMRSAGGLVAGSSLAAFLAACGGSSNSQGGVATNAAPQGSPPAHATGSLGVALAGDPGSIDPTLGFSLAELAVIDNMYEGLVTFDAHEQLAPGLATAWRVSDDAREWTFELRDGVTFHDGAPFDASAVKRSLEYYGRRTSGYAFAVGAIASIDAADPRVVKVRYKDPFPDLARNCTLMRILSPKLLAGPDAAVERRVATSPSGTGPFRFGMRQQGQSIALRANEAYWGKGPYVQTLQFRVVPQESARVAALQAGDVDLVMQVAPLNARTLGHGGGKVRAAESRTWTTVGLSTNTTLKPFDDVRVRQALAYAVDRQSIVDKVLLGQARVNDSALPPGVYGYRPAAVAYPFDAGKARALLRQAGAEGASLSVGVSSEAVLGNEIGQAIVAQLSAAGFKAKLSVLDNATYVKDLFDPKPKNAVHYIELGWVNGGPLHLALGSFSAPTHFDDKRFTALVAKMGAVKDGPVRLKAIGDAIDLLAQKLPVVPLWVPSRIDAFESDLQGYAVPEDVFPLFGDVYRAA